MVRLSEEDRATLTALITENGIDKLEQYITQTFTPTIVKIRRISPENAHEWIDLHAFVNWLVGNCQQKLHERTPMQDNPKTPASARTQPAHPTPPSDVARQKRRPRSPPAKEPASQSEKRERPSASGGVRQTAKAHKRPRVVSDSEELDSDAYEDSPVRIAHSSAGPSKDQQVGKRRAKVGAHAFPASPLN
ncbi:hypothetical protein BD626DRAFT_630310 [Schizophyllum amplum]|uniref:Uncharacterized protein n=1 Tax=Schizophyllum amplum TaxID=97359 RepID=A0A550CEE0_9AGAR|nr:hypothetical protein BD626DRAFT_630310 [Auriculariopsis ampla]